MITAICALCGLFVTFPIADARVIEFATLPAWDHTGFVHYEPDEVEVFNIDGELLVNGYGNVVSSLAVCQAQCGSYAECETGTYLSGSNRHGECWLASEIVNDNGRDVDYCGVVPSQRCVAFKKILGKNKSNAFQNTFFIFCLVVGSVCCVACAGSCARRRFPRAWRLAFGFRRRHRTRAELRGLRLQRDHSRVARQASRHLSRIGRLKRALQRRLEKAANLRQYLASRGRGQDPETGHLMVAQHAQQHMPDDGRGDRAAALEARGREIYGDQWEEGVEGGVPLNVLFTLDDEDINAARNAAVGGLSVGDGNAGHEGAAAAALLRALQSGGGGGGGTSSRV